MSKEYPDDYEPFLMFRRLLVDYFNENHMEIPVKEQEIILLKTWGIVQGLSSVASMKEVEASISWEVLAKECIKGKK